MKRVLLIKKGVLALLLALSLGMGTAYAYDFSAVCSTGQTLYYNITDATNHYVEITFPGNANTNDWWTGYTKPTGNITLPSTVTYNSVTYTVKAIGHRAFIGCNGLTGSLTIPSTVTSIGFSAFSSCSGFTGTLTIPSSVTMIDGSAFYGCGGFTGTLTIPNSVTSIGSHAFQYCNHFTALSLGTSLSTIGNEAFYNDYGFTGSLTIPNSVTSIGEYAFINCTGFTGTLNIGTGLTSLGKSAFYYCTGFTQIYYNAINCADVTDSTKPFEGCTATTLSIGSSVQRIPAYMFYQCSNFTGSLNIPNSVTAIGDYAFQYCSSFNSSLTLGNSLTTIGTSAFIGCTGFTGSLNIPNSVTTIGDGAFGLCMSFTGLSLGSSLTTIGDVAFMLCTGFTGSLAIPNSVTTIGTGAFGSCTGFTGSLTIGNNVTTIGSQAFQGCGFTGALTIGSSVSSIDSYALSCPNISSMTVLPETPPTLGEDAFEDVPTSIPVYVPCVALEDYQDASGWSDFTNMKCRQTITMYEGTATSYYVPAFIFYFDDFTRSQFVIPAADLTAMKGTPISSMTFYTTSSNVPYTTVSSADVYLKEVNYTTISAYESKSSATTVYSGTFSVMSTGSGGEMTINFSTPYYYNGGNLLVGIENTQDAGFKQIYFYGQTVTGASIAGYNASSTGTIPATQRNFIPKTTFGYTPSGCSRPIDLTVTDITPVSAMLNWTGFQDSYNVRYRVAPPFYEDFEEEESFATDWTFTSMNTSNDIGAGSNAAGLHVSAAHSGESGFRFSSYYSASDYNQYLVSPRLDVTGELNFYYKQSNNNSSETFKVGYSTTTNVLEAFTWTDLTLTQSWQEYTLQLPSNVKYIAFHYYGNYAYFVYLDDITIGANGVPIGNWVRFYGTSNTSMEIHNLNSGTHYVWQVQGNNIICSPDGLTPWSRKASFTTGSWTFVTDGNWNDPNHWNTGTVPPAGSDVVIQANVTIPSGYTAVANEVTLDGGSITVADGGQLKHNTENLEVTMKKNIVGYDDANDIRNYYLLAFPFDWVSIPTAMNATGCDFYRFDPDESDAEWRNRKIGSFSVDQRYGYLFASPDDMELSLTGTTIPTSSESEMGLTIEYINGSSNPFNGWRLLGNPFTYNAYVYRFDSNNEFIPMPIMMYDAEGELQTVYGGPVAPMQGFFVHVTETTTVCFRGTGHGYVDLGLPSGLLWATCNVGADSPEDYGDYFAWGETTPKDYYDWDTYQYCMGSYNTMTKYCNNASYGYNGFTDNLTTLLPEDDAATANWGSGWRMPTKEEWQELLDNTAVTWTQQGGVNGRLFTASNGNSLFLPAAGYRWNDVLSNVGYSGDYWSSSLYTGRPNFAWDFYFVSDYCGMYGDTRDNGFTVRPVRSPQTEHAYVDLGLPSGTKWATCNVGAYSPEEYGDYFAWGETTPKDVYNWSTYQYCNGSQNTMTKYCNNSSYGYEGFTDDLTTLLPEDDAATANWGPDWRMPTEEEWEELLDNTTVTWTTQNGVNGRLFTATNGNSLFLPAAGYRGSSSLQYAGSHGNYWSSSLYTVYPSYAWYFYFSSGDFGLYYTGRRAGQSVRAVRVGSQN
ncbi:MAG: leucine-rich repeat protein [Bacteroidales bacterium]|nr:leucine-rich repeat protein [Bacteroidales bacterium]